LEWFICFLLPLWLSFLPTGGLWLCDGVSPISPQYLVSVKKSFMKQLSKLKDVDESSPFKNISISHDMTKN
jgi:hypothetical protein